MSKVYKVTVLATNDASEQQARNYAFSHGFRETLSPNGWYVWSGEIAATTMMDKAPEGVSVTGWVTQGEGKDGNIFSPHSNYGR